MKNYKMSVPSYEEADYLEEMLIQYNEKCKKFTQDKPFISINRCIKDENNEKVIAGIVAYSVMWDILYIDTLWVSEEHRKSGIGSFLLKEIEVEGKKLGCRVSHLDAFDFQGKDFYVKNKYKVFGCIEECPSGHSEYFLSKRL